MLTISIIGGIICFIATNIVLDKLFGYQIRPNHLSAYYCEVKGEEKKRKRKIKTKHKKAKPIKLDAKNYIKYALPAVLLVFIFCYTFIRSTTFAFILSPLGLLYPQYIINMKIQKRKELLNIQFRDMLQSVTNSLRAGNSLQGAIERSLEDVKRLLKMQLDKPIIEELETINYELQIGKNLDEALISFRDRVNMEDVDIFVNAALITKEKGGNLTEIMANVSETISDKIEIKREIVTLTAGKRAEAKLLTFMPLGLVLFLSFVSPSYMRPMYETLLGKFMMAIGLVLLICNYVIGKKIININI
ncbi:MAG: type II secretion system F family protein [Bacillota bacterium]